MVSLGASSENSAPTMVAIGVVDVPRRRAPPWRHLRGTPSSLPSRCRALLVKTQVLTSTGGGDSGGLVASLLGHCLGEHDLSWANGGLSCCVFVPMGVGGC
jgi:hypothetical protein